VEGLRYNDRVFVGGRSRSGKSELINLFLSSLRGQWVLIDSKPEFAIPDVEPVRSADELDFSERIIHYVPSATAGPDEFDAVFERCYRAAGHRTVALHELGDACDYRAQKVGRWVNAYISKGGAKGKGFIGGSQRPVDIPVRAYSEAEHIFYVVPRLVRDSDHKTLAGPIPLSPDELGAELHATQAEHGLHSFLWWDSRARELTRWDPLPEDLRSRIIVQRVDDA
jgi:hypothetical protein